jgi:hypothetical protein
MELQKIPFPNLRIDGYQRGKDIIGCGCDLLTTVYIDGKDIFGITEIEFRQNAEGSELKLTIDPSAVCLKDVDPKRVETTYTCDR